MAPTHTGTSGKPSRMRRTSGGTKNKGAGPRKRIAKMRASGNKSGAYKAIRKLRDKR